jgi:hypothetical protein
MRPSSVSRTGTGSSAWIPVDFAQASFNLSVAVVVNGTVTYDIEHTFDDIFDASVSPVAFKQSALSAQTANKDGSYVSPVRAVRVTNTAGTGTTTLTIIQGNR